MERNDKQMNRLIAVLLCLLSAFILFSAIPKTEPAELTFHAYESKTAININTADAEELASFLDGIGAVLAQKIVDYREENGPFSAKEDLMKVEGIGEGKFRKIEDKILI